MGLKLRCYPLATLYALLFLLNILDYLTTIYCLENIPNAYEANPWVQTPEVMFKVKIFTAFLWELPEFSLVLLLIRLE
jgi:hypothetical protein